MSPVHDAKGNLIVPGNYQVCLPLWPIDQKVLVTEGLMKVVFIKGAKVSQL